VTELAIEARDLSVRIGRATLLSDVELAVARGEVVALVGPNGAGKSTLLGALAGDRRPVSGTVRFDGDEVGHLSAAVLARRRAVLAQRSQLSLGFTALEVVMLAGCSVAVARTQLARVGIAAAFCERRYPTLSGGEQQRVQLARVLAQLALSPGAALLLDEPTSALDPRHQRLVMQLAREAAEQGRAVVVALHDLTLAGRWCDRVVLLRDGRVLADAEPECVLTCELLARAYDMEFEVVRDARGIAIVHG